MENGLSYPNDPKIEIDKVNPGIDDFPNSSIGRGFLSGLAESMADNFSKYRAKFKRADPFSRQPQWKITLLKADCVEWNDDLEKNLIILYVVAAEIEEL